MIAQLLGGIGLFLLGMLLLTDGLKAAAGETLKRILVRFTGRTTSAFFSGLTITAMVQSSSATTLATIGFVSAGLLTFSQAIGVVIGGSVGTTTTGWIVSLLGLKLSVGKIAMPLIGIGALMRLVLKGRPAASGLALAGFGLIFVGIDTLQVGMAGVANHVQPENFPGASLGGRVLLVFIGIALTVIMQSSSAAVATIITAYHAGTLNFEQALTLIIGASIGTTVTAALAAIGASVPAKRTALVHVLFNTLSASIGFVLLPIYVWLIRHTTENGTPTGAWSLAAFHTAFHLLGAAVVLPMVDHFARLITRLLPHRGSVFTRHLDDSLIQVPEVAIESLRRVLDDCAVELAAIVRQRIGPEPTHSRLSLANVQQSLQEARTFLARIPATTVRTGEGNARLSLVHALDHLEQLVAELEKIAVTPVADPTNRITLVRDKLRALVVAATQTLTETTPLPPLGTMEQLARELADLRRTTRHALLQETADARLSPENADRLLGAVRWMDTAAYHVWRAGHHLHFAKGGKPTAAFKEYPEPPAA